MGWYGLDQVLPIEDFPSARVSVQIHMHILAPVALSDADSLAEQCDLAHLGDHTHVDLLGQKAVDASGVEVLGPPGPSAGLQLGEALQPREVAHPADAQPGALHGGLLAQPLVQVGQPCGAVDLGPAARDVLHTLDLGVGLRAVGRVEDHIHIVADQP